ncbi:uncharacterized protein TNCV_3495651 [Trichonephila clavipes]|nr:uncharacterized protein TNCV_3495651 [Trichonephila clavipes]
MFKNYWIITIRSVQIDELLIKRHEQEQDIELESLVPVQSENPMTVEIHAFSSRSVEMRQSIERRALLSWRCDVISLRSPSKAKLNQMGEWFSTHPFTSVSTLYSMSTAIYFTVLEAKRKEFVDDTLIHAISLREELEISFEPPRRIRRKHIFGNGSKDVQLSYEDDLRRTMFLSVDKFEKNSICRIERKNRLFLRLEVKLGMDELN